MAASAAKMGAGSMTEAKVPEAWIGERVGVITEGAESFYGSLLEVNDRGVVIEVQYESADIEEEFSELREASEGEPLLVPSFFPWHSVGMVHLMLIP
jgi:hypothetical protein